jgi:hypothetical protein
VVSSDKSLISCSSEDIEFRSLLRFIQDTSVGKRHICSLLDDVIYETERKAKTQIYRGGLPINLDNSKEFERPVEIQLTRGLLLGAIIQAISLLPSLKEGRHYLYTLRPTTQQFVVRKWSVDLKIETHLGNLLSFFEDVNWINDHSRCSNYIDFHIKNMP